MCLAYAERLGHINHTLFWRILAPQNAGGGKLRDGPLKETIERDFGSFDSVTYPIHSLN